MPARELNPDQRSSLARARGWTLEQDQELEQKLWRGEWRLRADAQRLIDNNRAAESTGDIPTSTAEGRQERPREHRSRRSQRSSARGDPDSEPEPLSVIPVSAFRADVSAWLEAVGR